MVQQLESAACRIVMIVAKSTAYNCVGFGCALGKIPSARYVSLLPDRLPQLLNGINGPEHIF